MADPVLLIPGLNLTHDLYRGQMAAFAAEGSVILGNHRRHRAMAEMAAALLAEAPAKFKLVGLSMGGYAAMEMLRQAPERITKLVLADTTARPRHSPRGRPSPRRARRVPRR